MLDVTFSGFVFPDSRQPPEKICVPFSSPELQLKSLGDAGDAARNMSKALPAADRAQLKASSMLGTYPQDGAWPSITPTAIKILEASASNVLEDSSLYLQMERAMLNEFQRAASIGDANGNSEKTFRESLLTVAKAATSWLAFVDNSGNAFDLLKGED